MGDDRFSLLQYVVTVLFIQTYETIKEVNDVRSVNHLKRIFHYVNVSITFLSVQILRFYQQFKQM